MKQPKDYIVFPLDLPTYDQAMSYVDRLNNQVGLFKVGLELFISQGPRILKSIRDTAGAGIFLDLKLHDIPATVKRAFMAASKYRPRFVTIHCDEGEELLRSVAEDNPGDTKILAVTVLTSLDQKKLKALGYDDKFTDDLSALVLLKARMAKAAGCHGVVCSGLEVAIIKRELGPEFLAVTPGIRPVWSVVNQDDQKRIVTPADAVKNGADYVVIGRPIRDAKDPADAAMRVAEEIESAL
ncbi:MAG: orotidine-5'-phosphate decarboxylase [Deltaproteobacteria bacterium]|nr:orotidine-5'-phosphate decarboxylase [Deltaproteobacteria bacterium]MBW1736519.1 orotidine-5'-phosphate decarboxylase [Deltaproteobacteria bacterium]MBW1908653.1 orotidine-5'-phosphate decarboxylase [Deltaproteobacteria bacterium]MBW2033396.1 orotidine-5'-phosphate decarboxylase [Deltaproteobacteria bacterium]MBW2113942.1 orotidine-5'-phosphate decarboxylase [Deltaproteobacteria bacterium]